MLMERLHQELALGGHSLGFFKQLIDLVHRNNSCVAAHVRFDDRHLTGTCLDVGVRFPASDPQSSRKALQLQYVPRSDLLGYPVQRVLVTIKRPRKSALEALTALGHQN